MQSVANAVQLAGAAVTFLGLWHAYTRSRYGVGLWPWIVSKLRRRGPDQTIHATGIASGEAFGFGSAASGEAPFTLNPAQPVDAQLAQLVDYVRQLRSLFAQIEQDIHRMDRAIDSTRAYAESAAEHALTEAKTHYLRVEEEQVEADVLDLRIAIVGLAISLVGTVLAFWA